MLKIILLVTIFICCIGSICFSSSAIAATNDCYGAEYNPTRNPIGGGKGYNKIIKKWDFHVSIADELVKALAKAKAGQIIYVDDNSEINLTKQFNNIIPAGVTLAGGRGYNGSKGALIFSDNLATPGIFKTGGPKVRITGLRLRGPDSERKESAYVAPNSYGVNVNHSGFEIDNCEVTAWSAVGISLSSFEGRAYIHHNFIHHNQRSGLGYGIYMNKAAALIEANLFDWNRHAIAGGGSPGTSYEARYNLVLEHANSYSFDMHGGRDRKDGTDISGTSINIHHNTFRMTDYWGVLICGIPEKEALVHHNWFLHTDTKRAVEQYHDLDSHMYVYKNVFGLNKELRGTQVTTKTDSTLEWQGKKIMAVQKGLEIELIDYKDGKYLVDYKRSKKAKSRMGWIDAEQAKVSSINKAYCSRLPCRLEHYHSKAKKITITKEYCSQTEKKNLVADCNVFDLASSSYGSPQQMVDGNRSYLLFDGSDDYIDLGKVKLPGLDKSGTIIARFKVEAYQGGIISISMGKMWEDERLILAFNNSGKPPGFIFCQANGKSFYQYHLKLPKLDEWVSVALSWDGNAIAYYVNGKRQNTFRQYVNSETADAKFWIGQAIGIGADYYFKGIIDKVSIYSRPLLDEEILYQYKNVPPPLEWG